MRAKLTGDTDAARFAAQLLLIGNGNLPHVGDNYEVAIPEDLGTRITSLNDLIDAVYPNLLENMHDLNWLKDRAILAAKNTTVTKINKILIDRTAGQGRVYRSFDSPTDPENFVSFPPEVLNSLEVPGLPPHILELKIGTPVVLLRNLDPPSLVNGTRLVVTRLHNNLVEAKVINGVSAGKIVLIPRIPLIPSDSPIEFKRVQFPLRVCFAMTINKAQASYIFWVGRIHHNGTNCSPFILIDIFKYANLFKDI